MGASLLGVAALAVVTFAGVVRFDFAYDDHWTVQHVPAHDGALAPLLRALLTGRGAALGIPDATRPAMATSVWLDHALFGAAPAGYHLHSLLLYAATSALAVLAVLAVTRRRGAALAGGAWFAVAPVHAEVVAGVSYREDLIAAVAVVALVAFVFRARRVPEVLDHAVLAGALLVVGLLGKESAISLLPLLAVVAWVRFSPRWVVHSRFRSLASIGVATLTWGAWRAWLRLAGRDDVPLAPGHRSPPERVLRTGRYLVRSTLDALVPVRWAPDYAPEGVPSPWWWAGVAGIVALVWLLSRERRTRALAAGVAMAAVGGLATSPLVGPINERADRYLLIASLGGAVVWGLLLDRLGRRVPPRARLVLLGVVLLPLAVTARRAAAAWQSDATLWAVATERAPTSARAWAGLAWHLRRAGDPDGSDRAIERAIAMDPTSLRARVTRLYNRLHRGDVAGARAEILEIERLGGGNQLGMRLARRCVQVAPEHTSSCLRAGEPR